MLSYLKNLSPLSKLTLSLITPVIGISLYNPAMEKISNILYLHSQNYAFKKMPKRIILVRHGESEGNVQGNLYAKIPDHRLKLTERGKKQASKAGIKLKKIIKNESVKFYVSPYLRTQETYTQIVKSFNCNKKTSTLDHRIREQEFGNLNQIDSKVYKQRVFIGRFYYRFNNGENGADCFGRVSSFLDDLYKNVHYKENQYDNYVIVCHGIIMRVFLMKMLNLPIEEYQRLACPDNCKLWVLEKENKGKYKLITKNIKYYH